MTNLHHRFVSERLDISSQFLQQHVVAQSLSDKRNTSMLFVGYIICCNSVFLSLDRYLGVGYADRLESLRNGSAMSWTMLLPFWWRYLQGSPNAGSKRASVDHFWPLKHRFSPFDREYFENGRPQSQRYISIIGLQKNCTQSI